MIYTITAYRFGWLNGHQYIAGVATEAARALELANEVADDRAGKYGVAVHEWHLEGERRSLGYVPSLFGEEAPFHNERFDLYEGIGHDVHEGVTAGVLWQTPPDSDTQGNVPIAVEAPAWVVAAVRRREIDCEFQAALRVDLPLFQATNPTTEARELWADEHMRLAQKAADTTLAAMPGKRAVTLAHFALRGAEKSPG
jgi:hypothetical protein